LKLFQGISSLILTVVLLLPNNQNVRAFPMPPGFYGMVKVDETNVPAATVISAKINGVQYASTIVTTYQGNTVYSLTVPYDDPYTSGIIEGGVEGDIITFYIGNIMASQTATWHAGTLNNLNLTGYSVGPLYFNLYLPVVNR
jgi:hypothetical protein